MGGRGASSSSAKQIPIQAKKRFKDLQRVDYSKPQEPQRRLEKRQDIIDYVKTQTNVDLTPVLEETTKRSRTYLGVHLEDLGFNERNQVVRVLKSRGIRLESNGGLGDAIWYEKKKGRDK